jgi:RHS repeat-associated protein
LSEVETIWETSAEAKLVHSTYGRNRVGGVNWRRDNLAHAMSVTDQDNYYWYDCLQQVTRHDRGNLVPTSGAPYVGIDVATRAQQELFNYDETGNWNAYHDQVPSLNQTRTHTTANEIDSITAPTDVVQPAYDLTGNMTTCPKTGEWDAAFTFKWDAWNRLVEIKQGATVVATNQYDALTRRTRKTSGGETRDYYYNDQWRCIEEQVSGDVKAQFIWCPWDRWNLIKRLRSASSVLDEALYVAKDYLDPVAIIRSNGSVSERYEYEAFGPVRIMDEDYAHRTTSAYVWNFLFHAEFLDSDSGLYNYGYRFYHPNLGRWISKDPIEEEGGINLYGMLNNSPQNNIDLLGNEAKCPQGWKEVHRPSGENDVTSKQRQDTVFWRHLRTRYSFVWEPLGVSGGQSNCGEAYNFTAYVEMSETKGLSVMGPNGEKFIINVGGEISKTATRGAGIEYAVIGAPNVEYMAIAVGLKVYAHSEIKTDEGGNLFSGDGKWHPNKTLFYSGVADMGYSRIGFLICSRCCYQLSELI